jgi:hypothetical protein
MLQIVREIWNKENNVIYNGKRMIGLAEMCGGLNCFWFQQYSLKKNKVKYLNEFVGKNSTMSPDFVGKNSTMSPDFVGKNSTMSPDIVF